MSGHRAVPEELFKAIHDLLMSELPMAKAEPYVQALRQCDSVKITGTADQEE